MLKVSTPIMMENALLIAIISVTTYFVNQQDVEIVAGYAISTQLSVILYHVSKSISSLVAVKVGNLIGLGDFGEIKRVYRVGVYSCLLSNAVILIPLVALVYFLFRGIIQPNYFLYVFYMFVIDVVCRTVSYPLHHSFMGLAQGLEETKMNTLTYYGTLLVFRVPLLFLLQSIWGIYGIIVSMSIGIMAHGVVGNSLLKVITKVGLKKFEQGVEVST